jgi:hypothetical protein
MLSMFRMECPSWLHCQPVASIPTPKRSVETALETVGDRFDVFFPVVNEMEEAQRPSHPLQSSLLKGTLHAKVSINPTDLSTVLHAVNLDGKEWSSHC